MLVEMMIYNAFCEEAKMLKADYECAKEDVRTLFQYYTFCKLDANCLPSVLIQAADDCLKAIEDAKEINRELQECLQIIKCMESAVEAVADFMDMMDDVD